MKPCLLALILFCNGALFAQPSLVENKVTIVSCKTGDLYIDGTLIGKIEADDAISQALEAGEHYLQVKTLTEKFNITTKIELNVRNIIRIGCDAAAPAAAGQAPTEVSKPILLLDKQLNLSGAITNEVQQNIVALDEGDNIILSCAVLNKKGSANISIREYFSNAEIYRREGFDFIDQQKIPVPTKGIYIFNVTTGALFGKDIKLSVSRIPSPHSSPNFKTSVRRYFDTTHAEVLTTDATVHSSTNANGNKSTFKISLPVNTSYWAFWIGVGQDANEKMKKFIGGLSTAARTVSADPLVLLGLKIIPALPVFNSTSTISYRFLDSQNANLFMSNRPVAPLSIKYSDNIASDYAIIDSKQRDLVLAMWNNSTFTGQDVNIRVVAFTVRMRLAMDE